MNIKTLEELKEILPENNHLLRTNNSIIIVNLNFYMDGQIIDRIRIGENNSDGFVFEITLKDGGQEGQIRYDHSESESEMEHQLECIMEHESAYSFMSSIEEELGIDFEGYKVTKDLHISNIDFLEYSFEVEIESPEKKVNPIEMIEKILENSYSEHWAEDPTHAAIYGILVGWDSEENIQYDDDDEDDVEYEIEDTLSYSGLQRAFGWSDEYVDTLRKAHKALQELKN